MNNVTKALDSAEKCRTILDHAVGMFTLKQFYQLVVNLNLVKLPNPNRSTGHTVLHSFNDSSLSCQLLDVTQP